MPVVALLVFIIDHYRPIQLFPHLFLFGDFTIRNF